MSIDTIPIPTASTDQLMFPLSVEQYHAMIDAGILMDGDPVELLEGLLILKMSKNPPHRLALRKLFKVIDRMLPSGFFIQLQEPITLTDGEPEPDASVIRGEDEDYATRHPAPGEVPLIVEVADVSLPRDRGIKLRSYARAGLPIYWIVDVSKRSVTVYTSPNPSAKQPIYDSVQPYDEQSVLPFVLDGQVIGEIKVADILP